MSTETEATHAGTRRTADLLSRSSAVFGLVAALALAVNTAQLVWPGLGGGVGFLTFGRLRPAALLALVFGWLGLGLLSVGIRIVARAAGGELWRPLLAQVAAALTALSVGAGLIAVWAGETSGALLFEFPLWSAAGVAAGLALVAVVVGKTAGAAEASDSPALWFSVTGSVWLALGFVAGALPGPSGMGALVQNTFGITAVVVVGLTALALGAAYSVVAASSGRAQGTNLSRLGFWSFAFIAAWTAPRLLVFGPGPDWLETIAIVFSMIFLVPVLVLASDLMAMSREAAHRKLIVAGAMFLALFSIVNLVASFRSPSSIVRFTSWEDALLLLPLLGSAGCWLLAYTAHRWGRVGWRYGGVLLAGGTAVAAFGWLAGGLHQGLTWAGGVNAGQPTSAGVFFASEATAWLVISLLGIVAASLGVAIGAAAALRPAGSTPPAAVTGPESDDSEPGASDDLESAESDDFEPAEPITTRALVRGAVGLFALAAVSVFVIPALDTPNRTATVRAEAVSFADGSAAERGRDLYVSEGCVYCHTQQVRPIVSDVGLGAVSVAGDYTDASPVLAGYRRIGPDLTHVGERTESTRVLLERLRSPRGGFGGTDADWPIMPAYDHLSDADLAAIAEYLGALN